VATTSRTESPDLASDVVRRLLETEPYGFEFFQAVRLLQQLMPDAAAVGGYGMPGREAVRFRVHASTTFPASEIQALEFREVQPPLMTVNFMGLTGPTGVLPLQYTEFVRERLRARDTTLRDFLDIIHHRLISLFYLAWEKYRAPVTFERGEGDPFRRRLLSFVGLGMDSFQNRQEIPDPALPFEGGLLLMHTRPAAALEGTLRDYFEVPVEIEQFVGAWFPVETAAQCELGEENQSACLGRGVVVGDEIWDGQSRVRIKLGPLRPAQYEQFMPGGTAYSHLRAWARFFIGLECAVEVRLILRREDVPACELTGAENEGPRLGWTTWMKSAPFTRDPDETTFDLV
jgi:type VI secretion system protein ImpH